MVNYIFTSTEEEFVRSKLGVFHTGLTRWSGLQTIVAVPLTVLLTGLVTFNPCSYPLPHREVCRGPNQQPLGTAPSTLLGAKNKHVLGIIQRPLTLNSNLQNQCRPHTLSRLFCRLFRCWRDEALLIVHVSGNILWICGLAWMCEGPLSFYPRTTLD